MEKYPPVKYVLYSHFGYRDRKDFESWTIRGTCDDLEGIRYLRRHLVGLRELLIAKHFEGLLVLFYAPDQSFAQCLEGIARGMLKDDLLAQNPSLRFARDVAARVESDILNFHSELSFRLRFVTPIDLYDIFGRMNWATAINLRWWFIGSTPAIRYDAPKIVEAIVRLRLLGTGLPVFRVDYDVLFREGETVDNPQLGLFQAIASCLEAHKLRRDEASVATFLFSASYDTSTISNPDKATQFASWNRAFATRVFPALPVVPDSVNKVGQGSAPYTWDDYATEVFDKSLAQQFYGLARDELRSKGRTGIAEIGAHPLVSIISGALLCLSEGAIVDLPPFSNFGLNVSWIDDHLKYILHRELRHLTTVDLDIAPLLSDAKLDSVIVPKFRDTIQNLPEYVLGVYLPTLLWGTIMDAWINPNSILKYRPIELSDEDKVIWRSLQGKGQSQGVLSAALQTALEKGHVDKGEKQDLRAKLVAVALKRINEVRHQWAELADGHLDTFASIWAKGTVRSVFANLEPRCNGIAEPSVPVAEEIKDVFHINHFLYDDFRALLDDAIDYVEWTLHWPQIVQVVRSVEQGSLRTDVSWKR